ncbi:polysaccharide deacetylase family protein [Nocardia stercoris]|uniref:Polysaccharide deacetylase family protein n=2 Tax=Nocardia stercoris TaxID=2483361 RepID=A0A3M2L8I3_9NOCA|nr:polysaccharide deacetylase family protein [Nocardia stercoris]
MHRLSRRQWLAVIAAGSAAILSETPVAQADPPDSGSWGGIPGLPAIPGLPPLPGLPPPEPRFPRTAIGPGTINALPGAGTTMALTIDDGASSETVGGFIDFARRTGTRLTFFVTAYYPSWTDHRDELRPLVDSGQIQLANHTWNHPALTKLPAGAIADQLNRAKDFLWNTFGVDGAPYYRPPFGYHNDTVDQVAADCGYTVPVMWYGTLSDTSPTISEDMLLDAARQWFRAQAIVIGHANRPTVTGIFDRLLDIVRDRNLSLVTLDDVLIPPGH